VKGTAKRVEVEIKHGEWEGVCPQGNPEGKSGRKATEENGGNDLGFGGQQ